MDLVRFADDEASFAAVVTGRVAPGILSPDHDYLRGGLEVRSGFAGGSVESIFVPEDLDELEETLARLERGESAAWMAESGRTQEIHFDSSELPRVLRITVEDPVVTFSQVSVSVLLEDDALARARQQLAATRAAFPREISETSPGVYVWARG